MGDMTTADGNTKSTEAEFEKQPGMTVGYNPLEYLDDSDEEDAEVG